MDGYVKVEKDRRRRNPGSRPSLGLTPAVVGGRFKVLMDIDPESTEVPRSAKGMNYVNQLVGRKRFPRRLVLGDFLDSTFLTSDSDPESDYRDHHAG